MSCHSGLTKEQLEDAIYILIKKEKKIRESFDVKDTEELVYDCDSCGEMCIIGEILECPTCSNRICLECYKKN